MIDMLQDIYLKYGFSREKGISLVRKGKSGAEEIAAIMKQFRENSPKTLAGSKVSIVKDYQTLKQTDMATGKTTDLEMPVTSNVLQYFTEDHTKVSIRPSGTEPKIKFYIEVHIPLKEAADYLKVTQEADEKIESIKKDLGI